MRKGKKSPSKNRKGHSRSVRAWLKLVAFVNRMLRDEAARFVIEMLVTLFGIGVTIWLALRG